MIEFSGANRSYCYVRYWVPADAKMAIRNLHNFHIRPGYPLAVTQSVDNDDEEGGISSGQKVDASSTELTSTLVSSKVLKVKSIMSGKQRARAEQNN